MYIVGVKNNKYHNFKIVFMSKFKSVAKFYSMLCKPFFNFTDVQDVKNVKILDNEK